MTDLLEEARIEAIDEIGRAILGAAAEVLARHGKDPKSMAILLGGMSYAVHLITSVIDPQFRVQLINLLSQSESRIS